MSQLDSKSADDEEFVDNLEESVVEAEETDEAEEPKTKKPRRNVVLEKPRANVYTVMLLASFFAIVLGCLCLYGEMQQYGMDRSARSAK